MLHEEELRHAAGDATAGDLAEPERAAFAQLQQREPALAGECAFWERLRSGIALHTPPAADPFLAERLLRRRDWELARRSRTLRLGWWTGGAVAAALLVGFVAGMRMGGASGLPGSEPEPLAWFEDGSAVYMRGESRRMWDHYMPLAQVVQVHSELRPRDPDGSRPWLGVWTRPVSCDGSEQVRRGHLLVRVAAGSPAASAGLRPGDVLTAVGGHAVWTPRCIAHQLAQSRPGQTLAVTYWRPGEGMHATQVTLASALE